MSRWLWLAGALLGLPSCGRVDDVTHAPTDAGSEVADAPLDLAAICRDEAVAFCHAHHVCNPVTFELGMGDEATCVEDETKYCLEDASAPGIVAADYEAFRRCIQRRNRAPDFVCRGYYSLYDWSALEGACVYGRGTLANGSGCYHFLQCASGYCDSPKGGCGTCADAPMPATGPTGAACDRMDYCADGVCMSGTCHALADAGESCADTFCRYEELRCRHGTCVEWAHVGESCDVDLDCMLGTVCDRATKRCATVTFLPAGAPCDPTPREGASPYGDVCVAGFGCMADGADAGSSTCTRRPGLGESCDGGGGINWCRWPLACTDGICQEPSVPTCP